MPYALQTAKTDTFNASGLAQGATSGTLTSGSFGSPSGTQLYVVDYDVPAKLEVISATVANTSVTSITRGLDGTSDVAHSANAKIMSAFVPSHYTQLGGLARSDAWTAHTATLAGFSGTPTQANFYVQVGKIVFMRVNISGTSNATNFTFTLPVAPQLTHNIGGVLVSDNGTNKADPGIFVITAGNTTVTVNSDNTGALWTGSGTKSASATFIYEAD